MSGYAGLATIIQARTDVTGYNTQKAHEIMDEKKQHPLPDDFLEQVYRVRKQVIQDSKGELFEDSTELIRQEREKRTKQLMQAATGQYDEEEESTTSEQS